MQRKSNHETDFQLQQKTRAAPYHWPQDTEAIQETTKLCGETPCPPQEKRISYRGVNVLRWVIYCQQKNPNNAQSVIFLVS